MGDDKVGVAKLPSEGRRREHNPGQAGDHELEQKPGAPEHWRLEYQLSAPHRCQPVKYLNAGRDRDDHRGDSEKCVPLWAETDRKHMVGPNGEADEADADTRRNHRRIAEHSLAGEDW